MQTERPFTLADAARLGIFGGASAILVALIGMIQAFSKSDIISDVITMSQVMLMALAFVPAFFAASGAQNNSPQPGHPRRHVSGAVTGLLIGLLAIAIEPLHLREVFVNATPQLVTLLLPADTTGLVGVGLLMVIGAAVGLVAALISYLPTKLRNATLISLVSVILIALLEDVLVVVIPKSVGNITYAANGLSVIGAGVLFVTILLLALVWMTVRPDV